VSASAINWLIPNAYAVACTRSPAHVHFDGTPPSRLPSPHISQVCWQLRLVASEQKGGPAGISLRAIARQLGMTPSAVHYYFAGREALLDALIVDGWDSLAIALQARYGQTRPLPAHERWIAVTRAHRAWALEHSSEYLLLYGHTGLRVIPHADPPQLQPTVLFDLQMAHVSGSLNAPPPPW
jgi:AcrR family transcriptional regulator